MNYNNEIIKGIAIAVGILVVVAFIVCCLSICPTGIENKTNPKVEEPKLIEATIVGIGTEYTATLKTEILCQDLQKGEYWKAEVSGTPSKGQNVVLEIENDKVVNVWFKQVGGNSHLFLRRRSYEDRHSYRPQRPGPWKFLKKNY